MQELPNAHFEALGWTPNFKGTKGSPDKNIIFGDIFRIQCIMLSSVEHEIGGRNFNYPL